MENKHFGGAGPCRFEGGACVYCGDPDPKEKRKAVDEEFQKLLANAGSFLESALRRLPENETELRSTLGKIDKQLCEFEHTVAQKLNKDVVGPDILVLQSRQR